jgi:hypothetical protein
MAVCGGFRPKGKPRFYAVGIFSSINDIPDNKVVRDLYEKGGVEKWSPRAETTVLPELVQSQFDEYCKEHFVSAAEREDMPTPNKRRGDGQWPGSAPDVLKKGRPNTPQTSVFERVIRELQKPFDHQLIHLNGLEKSIATKDAALLAV